MSSSTRFVRVLTLVLSLWVAACSHATPRTGAAGTTGSMAGALRADARAAYEAGDFPRCAELFARAKAVGRERASDAYDAACCTARAGDRDGAFARLEAALDAGFRLADHLSTDEDLSTLRRHSRWGAVLARARAASDAYHRGENAELARLLTDDQRDRAAGPAGIDWSVVRQRDDERRARVRQLLDGRAVRTAADFYAAAMVFQHGRTADDFRTAHALALKAVELDPTDDQARWLAAASKDRELMSEGQPQRYGTQFRKVDGKWHLYEVDPAVSDDERAQWAVPPLAAARRQAEAMNAQTR